MKAKETTLTEQEKDILIMVAKHPGDEQHTNIDIAQRLDISLDRVKTIIRRACAKLGARNRTEAIFFALRQGEVRLDEIFSLNELVEIKSSLYPDIFKMIMRHVREGQKPWSLPENEGQRLHTDGSQDSLLTKNEQDVLSLAGRGLTNREIADNLCLSTSSVRTFLQRAYTKLGVHNRLDAVMIALQRGEINVANMYSREELTEALAPLGIEVIEQIAGQISENIGQGPLATDI